MPWKRQLMHIMRSMEWNRFLKGCKTGGHHMDEKIYRTMKGTGAMNCLLYTSRSCGKERWMRCWPIRRRWRTIRLCSIGKNCRDTGRFYLVLHTFCANTSIDLRLALYNEPVDCTYYNMEGDYEEGEKEIGFVIDDRNAAGGCAYRVFGSGRIAGGSELSLIHI